LPLLGRVAPLLLPLLPEEDPEELLLLDEFELVEGVYVLVGVELELELS